MVELTDQTYVWLFWILALAFGFMCWRGRVWITQLQDRNEWLERETKRQCEVLETSTRHYLERIKLLKESYDAEVVQDRDREPDGT